MAVKSFAEKLGTYLAPTVYGETFQIKAVTDPNNLAYSNVGPLGIKRPRLIANHGNLECF